MAICVLKWQAQGGSVGWLYAPLPDPLLALLGALVGGVWTADSPQEEATYPHPGAPMRVHLQRWRLLRDGLEAGTITGDLEESGLNMSWSSYELLRVEARLTDGRVVRVTLERRKLLLSAEGFSDAALLAAAEAVGLPVRSTDAG